MLGSILKNCNTKQLVKWGSVLIFIICMEVLGTVLIPHFRKLLFDALQIKSAFSFWSSLGWFSVFMVGLSSIQGVKEWICHRIGLVIRKGIVHLFTDKIQGKDLTGIETPCGRINQDSLVLTDTAIRVFTEILISALIAIVLCVSMYHDPILLLWSLVYSGMSVFMMTYFRKPLIQTKDDLNTAESNHRRSFVLEEGQSRQNSRFMEVTDKYLGYIRVLRNYTFFSKIQNGLASLVPYAIVVPVFLAGGMSLGDVMAKTGQFDLLVINLTILVIFYTNIVDAQTSWIRLKKLWEYLTNGRI